jgi:hypothetical protein
VGRGIRTRIRGDKRRLEVDCNAKDDERPGGDDGCTRECELAHDSVLWGEEIGIRTEKGGAKDVEDGVHGYQLKIVANGDRMVVEGVV